MERNDGGGHSEQPENERQDAAERGAESATRLPRGVRVLVCGGRDFNDAEFAFSVLDKLHAERTIRCIIEGAAKGADDLAAHWMSLRDIDEHRMFKADWKTHGRAAGPLRNQRMIDEGKPDLVIAFPGGRGTEDMKKRARAAGIEVREVRP